MPIPVPFERPRLPSMNAVKVGVIVQATVVGRLIDAAGHLEGWKFRRKAHHQIDYPVPSGGGTIRGTSPSPGPVEHWIPWQTSSRIEHVALAIGVQSYATSGTPSLLAELYDFTAPAAPVLIDPGCEWRTDRGTLRNERLPNGGGFVYPIRYVSTTARAVDAAAVAGVTAPRVLNVGSNDGKMLAVKLTAEHVRVLSVTVFARAEVVVG